MAFNMFTKKSDNGISLEGASRQNNKANSQFIMKVREEDRRDKILEDVFMRSTEENPYLKQIEANIALCSAIANEKQSKQKSERRRMVRRQSNYDLRQLEHKLRAAYISKAVAAQNFELKKLKVEERAKALQESQILQAAHLRNEEYLRRRFIEAQEKKDALKSDLKAQMEMKEQKRYEEKLEIMKDKKVVDDATRQYKEDLIKNKEAIRQRKIKVKKEMDDYEALQAKWRENHTKIHVEKREKYEELVAIQEEYRRKFLQERQELKSRRALKSEEMGRENNRAEEKKRESFDFLTDLLVDEREAKEGLKSARENERKSRERINIRNDLIYQQKLKQQQIMDEKKEEERLHRDAMRIIEKQNEQQRIKDENKKKDTEANRKALLHALNEQKRLRAKEMKRLWLVESSNQADCQRRAREIQKSRAKLINEHAPALTGFLDQKVLNS